MLVIWQDPATRGFHAVGVLEIAEDRSFDFEYLPSADRHLASIPQGAPHHITTVLPAFFVNRVIDPARPEFADYVQAFDLAEPVSPIELLVRSGGRRLTDTFQIVEIPRAPHAEIRQHFFVSGVRHVDSEAALAALRPGERLIPEPEPDNPRNRRARRLVSDHGAVGYVPDWQLELLDEADRIGGDYEFRVVRVNPPDFGAHLRVLAGLEIRMPAGVDLDVISIFTRQLPVAS